MVKAVNKDYTKQKGHQQMLMKSFMIRRDDAKSIKEAKQYIPVVPSRKV